MTTGDLQGWQDWVLLRGPWILAVIAPGASVTSSWPCLSLSRAWLSNMWGQVAVAVAVALAVVVASWEGQLGVTSSC